MNTMSSTLLVGSTGFVGSNLMGQHPFSMSAHSTNVTEAYGTNPDLCVYAGVPSAMFLANSNPEADLAIMAEARENLQRINPKKVVLISTIAIYDDSKGKDECSPLTGQSLLPYGANRLQLENWVREDFDNPLIMRLPALYGINLKKNFVFDIISIAPSLLTKDKYEELSESSSLISASYDKKENGYYALNPDADAQSLRQWFASNDFNALSFTDSRSRFQFYGLDRLWNDIITGINENWDTFNLATPPVSAAEVYRYVRGAEWSNELSSKPYDYDMRTIHTKSGYLISKDEELSSLKTFVEAQSCQN